MLRDLFTIILVVFLTSSQGININKNKLCSMKFHLYSKATTSYYLQVSEQCNSAQNSVFILSILLFSASLGRLHLECLNCLRQIHQLVTIKIVHYRSKVLHDKQSPPLHTVLISWIKESDQIIGNTIVLTLNSTG